MLDKNLILQKLQNLEDKLDTNNTNTDTELKQLFKDIKNLLEGNK